MPKLFSIGQYVIFFWSSEEGEPIHVHIAIKRISPNSTKIWLTENGGCILANNRSKISQIDINKLLEVIGDNHTYICDQWKEFFETDMIKFYC